jgi:hypothetical protein
MPRGRHLTAGDRMSRPLSFKAQALDNTSPDLYQIGDELLSVEDQARRRQVANMISEVAQEGTHLLKADGAELIVRRPCFLAQVYSEQLDHAGRQAPILCCGEFSHSDDPQGIIQAIDGFAAKIGRTVDPEHIQAIRDHLATLKKKSRVLPLAVGIGIAVLLAALMLSVLHHGRWLRTQT